MNSLRSFALAITAAIMALGSSPVIGDGYGGRGFSEVDLRGCLDFRFDGQTGLDFNLSVPVAAVGLLTEPGLLIGGADCKKGEIRKRGIRTISVGPGLPFSPGVKDQTFTCCITLDPDGKGSARCPIDDEGFPTENFDFTLTRGPRTFFIVGTDSNTVLTGEGRSQTISPLGCQPIQRGGSIL